MLLMWNAYGPHLSSKHYMHIISIDKIRVMYICWISIVHFMKIYFRFSLLQCFQILECWVFVKMQFNFQRRFSSLNCVLFIHILYKNRQKSRIWYLALSKIMSKKRRRKCLLMVRWPSVNFCLFLGKEEHKDIKTEGNIWQGSVHQEKRHLLVRKGACQRSLSSANKARIILCNYPLWAQSIVWISSVQ